MSSLPWLRCVRQVSKQALVLFSFFVPYLMTFLAPKVTHT